MGTTKSQSRKRLSWALAFLVSGLLYAPMIAMAQTTEETEPPNEDDEETPVCPEEPFFRFSDEEVAETGLSRELLCVVADTALFRYDPPGPNESPDLLRRVLRRGPYKNLSDEQYRAVMEEAVRLWPQSHYAHAGLAQALLGGHGIRGTPADRRRAADEFLIAADIVFSKGGVRYVTELSQLLADLKDKEALDRYFQRVFDILPDGRGRYESYLDYAFALGKLGDERAETYFQKAIAVSPKGVGDAYDFYGRYLLDHGKAQKLLELLALNSKAEQVMYPPVFHYQRCQALEQLGRKAEAVVECQQARDLRPPSIRETPSPVGRPGSGPLSRGPRAPAEPGLLARLLGVGLAQAADYQNPTDDCLESQTLNRCDDYPDDPAHDCYFDYVWNFAELIEVEAKAETYGSRADVAWTVRDRVWRESTPACGNFPGADGTCTSTCSEIGPFCELQIKYCCVIRSGSFSFQHRAVSFENLKLAADVITSYTPEPTSGFKPTGASGCTTGVCDKSLACSNSGNLYEYAPEGPIYFYANCKKNPDGTTTCDPACKGFQPGIPVACNVVAKETCGNSTDGVGSDNCYGRETRNRSWYAGPNFSSSPEVTTLYNTKRLPVGTYIYRDDQFKNPGGKLIRVQARLQTAGQANLRVQLKNSAYQVIYDFGTKTFTSTSFVYMDFQSTIVVTPPVSQVILINDGPGVIIVQRVIGRD